MEFIKVKPRPGLKVLWPEDRRELKAEGENVPCTSYWLRRIRTGDVIVMADGKVQHGNKLQ